MEGINWYRETTARLCEVSTDPRLLDVFAAVSPLQTVDECFKMALLVWETQDVRHAHIKSRRLNARRALDGEPLHGNKVSSFAANLRGDYDAVTLDTHMANFFKVSPKDLFNSKRLYSKLADKIRRKAKKVGIAPAELQAVIWHQQREYGEVEVTL